MKKIHTNNAPAAIGPYSQAIMINNTLYSSGQIGLNPETMQLAGETVEEQAIQVCKNIGAVLEEAGLKYENIVKTTIFLQNIGDFKAVNEIYGQYFSHHPARSTVEVAKLPIGALVEIEFIAIK